MATDRPSRPPAQGGSAQRGKQLRNRNLALLAALIAFAVLIYIVSIVRMGGE